MRQLPLESSVATSSRPPRSGSGTDPPLRSGKRRADGLTDRYRKRRRRRAPTHQDRIRSFNSMNSSTVYSAIASPMSSSGKSSSLRKRTHD